MSHRSINLDDRLYDYFVDVSVRDSDVLRRLREETAALPESQMQVSPEQGQLMALLVKLIGARRAIEVGTFTGYSALCVAMALPANGKLVACDVSEDWTGIARRYWQEAGVADKITLRIGKAIASLDALIAGGDTGSFDFAFIDADKKNYDGYYERMLTLLRPNGLLAIDNVLWSGRVVDPDLNDPATRAICELNIKIRDDSRVDMSLVPIGDGLTLVRKRP